jgi:cell division septum initiation protein DivIVA
MSGIDVGAVASQAAQAMLQSLATTGKDVASYAQEEAKKLATSAAEIAELRATGEIDDEEARLQFDIQVQASKAVLAGIEGISLIGAEEAINAGLSIIGKAIQAATGLGFLA